ncbi:glycerol uptake facilitator protein [Marininema mesophilum]|uniref:Glycerol uptake facilitator protein n=1 Tax=Marininema mesophilum TaxID=1048340 RepID=A0A1H2Q7F3_9BACL|nr:MIP/aquaporin family protein [Marininema mesophilum]SDW02614.1 glycerol uptake facilitator protein [Marininema mesophilum]
MDKKLRGQMLSEFLGTFMLIFIGCGTVAGLVLNKANLGQWEISLIWGLAVTMAIYVTGAISGTHINPAVTIANAVFRDFPAKNVIPYIVSQVAGAFAGAAVVYGIYRKAFLQFEDVHNMVRGSAESVKTAGIFSTYPASFLTNWDAFIVEFSITAFLLVVILGVTDDRNPLFEQLKNVGPLLIGFTVAIIGASFGNLTGFALNPARDFGPKLFAWLAGWDSVGVPGPGGYAWVPIVAPILGGLAGALIYDLMVRRYLAQSKAPVGQVKNKAFREHS